MHRNNSYNILILPRKGKEEKENFPSFFGHLTFRILFILWRRFPFLEIKGEKKGKEKIFYALLFLARRQVKREGPLSFIVIIIVAMYAYKHTV